MPSFTITLDVSDRAFFVFERLRLSGIGTLPPAEGEPVVPLERKEFLEYVLDMWLTRKWNQMREEAEKTLTDEQIQQIIEGS